MKLLDGVKANVMALLLFICAVVALWWVGQQGMDTKVSAIPELVAKEVLCEISPENGAQFYIYGSSETLLRELGNIYCQHEAIQKHFGSVKSYWGVNDKNTLHLLGNGIADLVLVKETFMQALKAEQTHGYRKIAIYPNYKAFFISLKEKPEISKEYLMDKTLGLVDYPTSRSAHIIPKQVFNRLGLSLEKLNVIYANSHHKLRELLEDGKVDIISSYWGEEDKSRYYERYITEVSDEISGAAWYFKMTSQNDELFCAVQEALLSVAKLDNASYFKKVEQANSEDCVGIKNSLAQGMRVAE